MLSHHLEISSGYCHKDNDNNDDDDDDHDGNDNSERRTMTNGSYKSLFLNIIQQVAASTSLGQKAPPEEKKTPQNQETNG